MVELTIQDTRVDIRFGRGWEKVNGRGVVVFPGSSCVRIENWDGS